MFAVTMRTGLAGLVLLLAGPWDVGVVEAAPPVLRDPLKAPLTALPALRGGCSIRGMVRNLPSYLRLKVFVNEQTRTVAEQEVAPGTTGQAFRFDGLRCNRPGGEVRVHHLFYRIRRAYGDPAAPRWGESRDAFSYGYPGAYGLPVNLTTAKPQYDDGVRDLAAVAASGLLIDGLHSDQASYRMGDPIEVDFDARVQGPAGVVESATYAVTVRAGGFEQEVQRGRLDVAAGAVAHTRVRIHHSRYSRGRVVIELAVDGDDYHYRDTLVRTVD